MDIKQFEDKNLAHYSYAVASKGEVALIDPARDPRPYYAFAKEHHAVITTVIETHPHADFISSHLEIHHTTGATIYASKLLGAEYPHQTFDEDDAIILGSVTLKALNTPGHSPDSISIVLIDETGTQRAAFTGDTLFIGDCGRPDLRERTGAVRAAREELARQMYHSLHEKLMNLPDEVLVYPAHGAGSLCGKDLSQQNTSTIGAERRSNWSLQHMEENAFVKQLLADLPFVPKYFPFDVSTNKKGAGNFAECIGKVEIKKPATMEEYIHSLDPSILIVDTRPQVQFKKGHIKHAINLMNDTSFETWLGSIVNPGEPFYLVSDQEPVLHELTGRIAKIGYEKQVAAAIRADFGNTEMKIFDAGKLRDHEDAFTIVDIRNPSEVKTKNIFQNAIRIPLYELRERAGEIPVNKPIVVHCEAGFRSAAGSSILQAELNGTVQVYDLGEAIKTFSNEMVQ